jgi:hypothetical protein
MCCVGNPFFQSTSNQFPTFQKKTCRHLEEEKEEGEEEEGEEGEVGGEGGGEGRRRRRGRGIRTGRGGRSRGGGGGGGRRIRIRRRRRRIRTRTRTRSQCPLFNRMQSSCTTWVDPPLNIRDEAQNKIYRSCQKHDSLSLLDLCPLVAKH